MSSSLPLRRCPFWLLVVAGGLSLRADVPPPIPAEDAELTGVAFVNLRLGWAVGDRGVILHTDDGGASWTRQPSGVACRLRSVCFVDERNGWAVGGESIPQTDRSRGVVLRTTDGGTSWQPVPTSLIPGLRQVRFTSPTEGWAVGDVSTFAPSGLFFSRDGGRTWNPAGGAAPHGLLTADFAAPHVGAAATASGELLTVSGRVVREAPVARFGLRAARKLTLRGDGRGWLVGDGGLVQTTDDGGASWRSAAFTGPLAVVSQCDWRSVAAAGSHVWIVGSPGGVVLHTGDDGRTWQLLPTGSPLPLDDVSFIDELHGWAVGALGTILRTADGGRTWTTGEPAPRRAALWCSFADVADLPYELLAQSAQIEGYRVVASLFGRREFDVISGDRDFTSDRAADALATLGTAQTEQAWAFPLRAASLRVDPARFVATWEGLDDVEALGRAEAYLVRQLRTWRPDVVLTHAPSPRGDAPVEQLLHQLVVEAIDAAADPTRYPEQLDLLGLAPWSVKRLFTHAAGQQRGTVTATTAEIDSRLGATPADLTLACRTLLCDDATPPPAVAARLAANRTAAAVGDRSLCAGLGISPASDARRFVEAPETETLLQRRDAAERRRNLQAIAARSAEGSEKIVGELRDVVANLDQAKAGLLVFQLAETFRRSGRWEPARETYEFLVANYPQHPTAEAALSRLICYLASGEADWRLQRAVIGEAATTVSAQSTASVPGPILGSTTEAERRRRGLGIAAFAERRDPAAAAEPGFAFATAAARRRLEQTAEAEQFYDLFVRTHGRDAWWEWAAAELPRADRGSTLRHRRSARSATEPKLDGVLDDDAWCKAEPLELRSPYDDDGAWPAAALIAHDDEHLYLAVRCRRAPGDVVPPAAGPRTRDADLSPYDRVDFCFDVDRDLATYYRLTIDCRGWTNESCWDDRSWNPQWYAAAGGDDETWIVEAAIPWSELVPQPPRPGDVWACGVQRLAPTAGLQSWTAPVDVTIRPEGFGRLSFE